ncbi:MAG: InlB B-repeat-containing protein, partial [Treponema sp.]
NTAAGTTVHCTVTEVGGTTAPARYDGNPVTFPLGLDSANEKTYKVDYYTDGIGYKSNAVKTKYYKVLKQHTVTFNANGGKYADNTTVNIVLVPHNHTATAPATQPTRTGYTFGAWYTDSSGTSVWNSATPITADTTIFAKWTPNTGTAYKVEHYQEETSGAGHYPASPADTENLFGTTGAAISVTQKNYAGFEFDRQEPASATIGAEGNTVVKVFYKRKTVTLTFNLNGGNIGGSMTAQTRTGRFGTALTAPTNPVKTGYTFSDWQPVGAAPALSSTFPASDATYTAQWNPASGTEYKVKHYQENLDGTYPSTPTDIESMTGQTDHTFTAAEINGMKKTTYQGFEFDKQELNHPSIKADGTTIIKLFYKRKTVTVTFKLNGGKISGDPSDVTPTGKYGAPLAKPADPTKPGYTFSDWQPTPPAPALSSTFPAANAEYTAKWTANTYTVRFNVYGGTHGTLKANPEGGTEKTTSTTDTVSVEHGKKVTFTAQPDEGYEVDSWTGATADTPNTTATLLNVTTDNINVTVKFKKKVYTVTFSVAAGEGSLKGEGGGYINTATGTAPETLTVPYGGNVDFTATPKSGGVWKVAGWMKNNAEVNGTNDTYTLSNVTENTTVKVKFYQPEITGTAPMAWRDLLSAVRNAPANATVTINGEIKATHISGNNGEIVINKNLTIKGKKTDGSDTLNAVTLSRIFKVKTGNTLILENITLKNGKAPDDPEAGDTENGGGIYSEGTLTLNNTTITSCGAKNGGGIYAQGGTEITLTNTEINSCVAEENGGGLYIKDSRLTLTNAAIGGEQLYSGTQAGKTKGNKAKNGCGIFLTGSGTAGSTMTGGKVSYNLATDTSGAHGGGIYIEESASFTMQSGNINNNKLDTRATEDGGGVYVHGQGSGSGSHASFTLNGGTIENNWAGFGGGVMVTAGGKFTMNNGTMSGNVANYGGGVRVGTGGDFTMKNGTITGNIAHQDGKAISVQTNSTFNWEGGSITGHTVGSGDVIDRDGGTVNNPHHYTES